MHPEGLDALRTWFGPLMGDLKEVALDKLHEENCLAEALYLLHTDREPIEMFVGLLEGETRPPNLKRPINREHFRHLASSLTPTLEPVGAPPHFERIERLYRLERRQQPGDIANAA